MPRRPPVAPARRGGRQLTGFTVGYYNSIFWGAEWNVYPADPDTTDAVVPGTATRDVGSIRLNPAVPPDPADPLGIAARDPDAIRVIASPGVFSPSYVINNRPPSIDDQHSVAYTGRVTIPADGDAVPDVHDVDGSGSILARDYSEVKKRFFHTLGAPPASPPVALATGTAGALPLDRRAARDLFGAEAILA